MIAALLSIDQKDGVAVLNQRRDIGSGHYKDGHYKDSFWGTDRVGAQTCLECEGSFQRQTIEEFHHALYHGLEIAFPSVVGPEPGTELMVAVEQAYGDCEFCSDCAPDANTTTAKGRMTARSYQEAAAGLHMMPRLAVRMPLRRELLFGLDQSLRLEGRTLRQPRQ